ncbi:class I SAM-dependent methyltransferase [Aquimarina sp. AU474]|uniref:class I SAM-dependent methyltransferase n=1 Tax=Aquimarina sp. AU474 TaxID=2108529 RepID=UPI000D695850|nr:class I SAM-dependent methyltransferase [Aquimarina sp. AU474]
MQCSLCASEVEEFSEIQARKYFNCTVCKGISLDPNNFLSAKDEKNRYQLHDNDINDSGYQKFALPIVNSVLEVFDPNHNGLDFGSGSGPVITSLLRKEGYKITTYDPFFDPNTNALKTTYDYIVCCEVIEHFFYPQKEFKLLYSLLKPNGVLYCKTNIYNSSINFKSWWYKNDPTHVFFYSNDALNWIAAKFGFKAIEIKSDLIIFEK